MGFGKQQHVALVQLLMRAQAADQRREVRVCGAEALAVSMLEEDVPPQVRVDVSDVPRMDRQPPLMLLTGPREDSEGELFHSPA